MVEFSLNYYGRYCQEEQYNMTDIIKQTRPTQIQKEEVTAMRERLLQIIRTMQYEKNQYDQEQSSKLRQCTEELEDKKIQIDLLRNDLIRVTQQLEQLQRQNYNYQNTIKQLKEQIQNMTQVSSKNKPAVGSGNVEFMSLARVKSDLHENKIKSLNSTTSTPFYSPQKFDFNKYTQTEDATKLKRQSVKQNHIRKYSNLIQDSKSTLYGHWNRKEDTYLKGYSKNGNYFPRSAKYSSAFDGSKSSPRFMDMQFKATKVLGTF